MDLLFKAAGISATPEPETIAKFVPKLEEAAERFLDAGGSLSLADFALLTAESREAFVQAGRRRLVAAALRIALAMQGPEGAADVLRAIDGGQAAIEIACARAAQAAADRARGVKSP